MFFQRSFYRIITYINVFHNGPSHACLVRLGPRLCTKARLALFLYEARLGPI
jgi:hypothetical protein